MSKKTRTVHYLRYFIEEQSRYIEDKRYCDRTFEQCMDEAIASLQHGQEVTQRLTGKKVVLSLHKGNVITHAGCKSSALYQIEEGKGVAAEAKDDVGNHIVAGQPVIPNVNSTSGETLRDDFYRMANLAEGITYFAYKGNHLAYFSESSSAASTLLSFFNFFLKTLTKVVPDSSIIHEEKIFPSKSTNFTCT